MNTELSMRGYPVEICGMLTDIVKTAQKFEKQNFGCAVFVSSNIAHRDKVKYCLINVIPSTRECLLYFKISIPMCFLKIYLFLSQLLVLIFYFVFFMCHSSNLLLVSIIQCLFIIRNFISFAQRL